MRKFLLLPLLSLFIFASHGNTNAQCVPDTTIPEGFIKALDSGCVGNAYNDTLHFAFSDSTVVVLPFGNFTRKLDSVEVDQVNFLPAGINVACVNTSCKFITDSSKLVYGCIIFSGTPTAGSTMDSVEVEMTRHIINWQGQPTTNNLFENVELVIGPFGGWSYTLSGNSATFTSGNTTASSYLWDFGDGDTSAAQSPTHIYDTTGTYVACLTVTDACGTGTTCDTVMVCPAINSNWSFEVFGDSVQFTDSSSGWVQGWVWNFGTFGPGSFSFQQNPSRIYNFPNTYNVCLTVTDSCGATDSTCHSVTIQPPVAISDDIREHFQVWPNPATSKLSVRSSFESNIQLLDILGRPASDATELRANSTQQLDLDGIRPGIYLLRGRIDDAQTVIRIVKE